MGVGAAVVLLLVVGLAGAPGAASAQTVPSMQRERVIKLLQKPVSESTALDWARIGPRTDTNLILVDMIGEKELPRIYRARAIEALAFFPTKRSKQVLWELVYSREGDAVNQKLALRSLGATWQADALFDLVGFLDDPSPVLREGAVLGIGLVDDPRVTSILENRLYQETSITVRLAIEKALDQARANDIERARRQSSEILGRPPRTLPRDIEQKLEKMN